MFIIMIVIGMAFNAMNILAYKLDDLYVSLTLFYGGLLMASNMIWGMEIVHYLDHGHFNIYVFLIGILLSVSAKKINSDFELNTIDEKKHG